tara:strand:- start:103 stop:369 length:267 start_codon:yes stop_codon:yes gene_type:complete
MLEIEGNSDLENIYETIAIDIEGQTIINDENPPEATPIINTIDINTEDEFTKRILKISNNYLKISRILASIVCISAIVIVVITVIHYS